MGRKTDRGYITAKEWTEEFGGKRANMPNEAAGKHAFKPLPYYSCALSLQPFETPVATQDGIIFEVTHILPWLKKYKIDPITGKPLTSKDLFPLIFHKNEEGKFHCPITFKEFTDFSHIVAIKPSGHVYSYDAIEELNLKPKSMKCLMTETPFTKSDIITIQDPKNLERRNLANFHHIKTGMKAKTEEDDPLDNIVMSESKKKMLRELNDKHTKEVEKRREESKEEDNNEEFTYVSAAAPGLTSSVVLEKKMKVDARDIIKSTDKKGYVRLHTTKGDLNVELHCDMAPKTCENFLGLCEKGYYENIKFHRLIPHFMIQGGDPTGTGRGGQSLWGKPFKDEFHARLQHSARGILSMANSGKDSNGSQFFITFGPCAHLDHKHSVFGKVVGGNETLAKMESVETDEADRPLEDIVLKKISVYVNPFKEDTEEKKAEDKKKEEQRIEGQKRGQWYSNPAEQLPKAVKAGVGKYINSATTTSTTSGQKRTNESAEKDSSNSTTQNKKPSLYGNLDFY